GARAAGRRAAGARAERPGGRGAGRGARGGAGARRGARLPGRLTMPREIDRYAYAHHYGPTVGDRVRPAAPALLAAVEADRTVCGAEVKFGGGKVIRDGMGQAAAATDAPDLVITNALIVDHWGIVKADVGVKDGLIRAIGNAGNPDVMDGV